MFTHPARSSLRRSRSYGELTGGSFYAIRLPNPATVEEWQARRLRSAGVSISGTTLPAGTVVALETFVPLISKYEIFWVNGKQLPSRLPVVQPLETELERYAGRSSKNRAEAISAAESLWSGEGMVSDATSDASESGTSESMPDEDLSTSDAGWSPLTGYYTDSGGYAWYYNAAADYMEAVAAPKGTRLTGTRFSAASGSKYAKMKGVLTESAYMGDGDSAKQAVIRNATGTGGETVAASAPARGTAPAAAAVPEDVAERGEKNLEKDGKKKVGILAGVTSGIPTWAWWTAGGLTLAGGGYMLYRIYKQNA